MLSKKMLSVAVILVPVLVGCGSKDKDKDDAVTPVRPQIPLNAPSDLLGSWKQCTQDSETTASGAIYTFRADGSLEFKSVSFSTKDCSDAGTVLLTLKGSYVAGSDSALDLTIGKKDEKTSTTVYRVFSVQGNQLLISNNAVAGSDADHRDFDLNASALKLVKMEAN
ncbi:hypothetical protein [Oligoflexus tunisiensis]|uniref:hypothetical protein n=1 Tax=Oligoflexus tunisiensis TaxID=708132 RepID=UPI00114D2B7F|nr:hypothetical protein [Oligoflexus tunisiensis]